MKRRWQAIVRVTISVGLLAFVFSTIGLERIWHILVGAEPAPVIAALGLAVLGIVVRAMRWRVLLEALDLQISLGRLTYIYFVGAFFNTFLPTGFGGDVVRVLELAHDTQATVAVGTVVVDRLTGLLMLFVLALVALPFTFSLLPIETWLAIALISGGGLLVGALILQGTWLRRLGRWLPGPLSLTGEGSLARAYAAITACGWQAVSKALIISLVFNLILVLQNYLIARAVGMDLGIVYFFVYVPLLSLTLTLPISIGGLGLREGVAALLLTQVGIDEAVAVAYSLAVWATTKVAGLFGGVFLLGRSISNLRQPAAERGVSLEGEDTR
jgi:uncharacterized membrane protein YbhN (UPF0104 family)